MDLVDWLIASEVSLPLRERPPSPTARTDPPPVSPIDAYFVFVMPIHAYFHALKPRRFHEILYATKIQRYR